MPIRTYRQAIRFLRRFRLHGEVFTFRAHGPCKDGGLDWARRFIETRNGEECGARLIRDRRAARRFVKSIAREALNGWF